MAIDKLHEDYNDCEELDGDNGVKLEDFVVQAEHFVNSKPLMSGDNLLQTALLKDIKVEDFDGKIGEGMSNTENYEFGLEKIESIHVEMCIKSENDLTLQEDPLSRDHKAQHVVNKKPVINMLIECAAIKVEFNDGLPENICCACVTKLTTACSFKTMANECDTKLRDMARKVKEDRISHDEVERALIHKPVENDTFSNNVPKSANFGKDELTRRRLSTSDTDKIWFENGSKQNETQENAETKS
ncbi:hypothetical protein Trydic_g13321, partial [Trypoxylus dichotomus]